MNFHAEEVNFNRTLDFWRDVEITYISRELEDALGTPESTHCNPTYRSWSSPEVSEAQEVDQVKKAKMLADVPFHVKYHTNGREVFRVWIVSTFFLMILLLLVIFDVFSLWGCSACVAPCQPTCQKYFTPSYWADQFSRDSLDLDEEFVI